MIFSKQLLISNCCFDVEGAFRTGILQEAINVEYKWIFLEVFDSFSNEIKSDFGKDGVLWSRERMETHD